MIDYENVIKKNIFDIWFYAYRGFIMMCLTYFSVARFNGLGTISLKSAFISGGLYFAIELMRKYDRKIVQNKQTMRPLIFP